MLEMDEMRIGELQMVGGCLYNIARFLLNKVPGDDWCCELFFKVNWTEKCDFLIDPFTVFNWDLNNFSYAKDDIPVRLHAW